MPQPATPPLPARTPETQEKPTGFIRKPGDGWVECGCGARHWGLNGAAGLFLIRRAPAGEPAAVALQHRALWSHHGGTWAVPGGAIMDGESAQDAALRESFEEAGVLPNTVRVIGQHVLTHPHWSYTTIVAQQVVDQELSPTDNESLEISWVAIADLGSPEYPLLDAFEAALPSLLEIAQNDRP